jgi:hypothetical protein
MREIISIETKRYSALILILIMSDWLIPFRVFAGTIKPIKGIKLWIPVQSSSCPEIQIPSKTKWKDKNGFRMYHSEIDIDGDGTPDVIEAEDSSGSTAGMTSISLKLGATGEKIKADYKYSFESFKSETSIPPKLIKPKYRCVLKIFEKLLFHKISNHVDPSLEWLLEGKKHLRWVKGPPVLPETYTIRIKTPSGAKWVSYLGLNHSYRLGRGPYKPVVLTQKGEHVILGTSHGVILTDPKRTKHAWIYIYQGGAKLRWPSIKSAQIVGETAIVQLEKDPSGGPRNSQVRIDLNTGRIRYLERQTLVR